jgi:hypothetical protein
MVYSTLDNNISCNSEDILSISKSIFSNKKNNKYAKYLEEIQHNYHSDYSVNNTLNSLEELFELNNDLYKIVECKNSELENKEKEHSKLLDLLNKINDKITQAKGMEFQRTSKLNITESQNKNIEIYYIVYILFTILLLLIQTSVVIFK